MKIIIADDNKAFSEALSIYVETELGHQVISVHNNGLELISDPKIDEANLILTDIEMPKLNGIEAIKKLNINTHNFSVIAITNHYEKVYQKDLVTNGFKGCVYKDKIYNTLNDAINLVMDGKLYFNY